MHFKKHTWASCGMLSTWISHLPCSQAVTENQTLCFAAILRCVWGLFLLEAELWTDKWEVLQSPRTVAVGIPAWL